MYVDIKCIYNHIYYIILNALIIHTRIYTVYSSVKNCSLRIHLPVALLLNLLEHSCWFSYALRRVVYLVDSKLQIWYRLSQIHLSLKLQLIVHLQFKLHHRFVRLSRLDMYRFHAEVAVSAVFIDSFINSPSSFSSFSRNRTSVFHLTLFLSPSPSLSGLKR